MDIPEKKEILKLKSYEELLQMEIFLHRMLRKPYVFGLEVAKYHRKLIRQIVKEQISRKLEAWNE